MNLGNDNEKTTFKSSPEAQKGPFLRLKDFPSPITPPNKEKPSYKLPIRVNKVTKGKAYITRVILPYKSIDETYRRYLFHVSLTTRNQGALILVLSVGQSTP